MFDLIEKKIFEYLNSQWGSTTAIAWPNSNFDVAGQVDGSGNKLAWIRPTVLYSSSENAAIGKNFQRFQGVLIVQVFTEKDAGTNEMRTLTRSLYNIFKNANASGVQFRIPKLVGPQISKQEWYQKNLEIPFQFDQTS